MNTIQKSTFSLNSECDPPGYDILLFLLSLSLHLLSSPSLSFSLHIWTDSLSIVLLQRPFCLFSSHMSWSDKQTKLTAWYTHEHFRFTVEGEVRPLPQGCSPGPLACQSNNWQQWWPGDLLTPWLSSRASDCRCHRLGAAAGTPSGRASRMGEHARDLLMGRNQYLWKRSLVISLWL